MPPDPPDRLCSFPLALLSSFDIGHPLPHAVPNLTAPEMHACGMRHAPRLSTISFNKSFSTSAEREEVSLCTCTPVVLGKGAMSSVVQVLSFLFRQWRFPPRPLYALPRGSKAVAAAKTLSAHAGPAPRFPITITKKKWRSMPKHCGGLSGSTSHFPSHRDPFLTFTTHGRWCSFCVGHANLAVVAKRSTLGQEKTTNNGHSEIARASRLNRVRGFRLFNIRQWLAVCFLRFFEDIPRCCNPSGVSRPCANSVRQRVGQERLAMRRPLKVQERCVDKPAKSARVMSMTF